MILPESEWTKLTCKTCTTKITYFTVQKKLFYNTKITYFTALK